MNIGVILAGGIGKRFRNKNPKQFIKVHGKMLITTVIEEFLKNKNFDKIITVNSTPAFDYVFEKYKLDIVRGGDTRNKTVGNVLQYVKLKYPSCKKIVFHDSVRPLIKSNDFNIYLEKLDKYKAVFTTQKITDSLGNHKTIDLKREDFFLIQTPEAFQFDFLLSYFNKDSAKTAIVQQLPLKVSEIYLNFSKRSNFKITYPSDFKIFEALLKWDLPLKQNPNLNNKNILIFGASGGIGSETKREIMKRFPQAVTFEPERSEFDLENLSVSELHKYLKDNNIDIIINCAGAYHSDDEGLLDYYEEIMNVNLKANLQIIEAAKGLNKKINIVLISSSSSTKGRKNLTVYSASKVGVNSIVESLAEPLQRQNIYINVISPEKVRTPLLIKLHKTNFEPREVMEVEEVTNVIINYSDTNEFGKLIDLKKGYIM